MTYDGPERRVEDRTMMWHTVRDGTQECIFRDTEPEFTRVGRRSTDQRRTVSDEAPLPTEAEMAAEIQREFLHVAWDQMLTSRQWVTAARAAARVALRMMGGKG